MSFKCPKCARPLYNRRRDHCEFCGATIPQAQRLSAAGRQLIDRMKADEARQHREFMSRQTDATGPSAIGISFW